MEAQSNLYWWCCAYSYSASCVYKTVLILDILTAIILTVNGVLTIITDFATFHGYIWLLLGLFYFYLAFLGFPLLSGFSNNLGSGTLHPQTDNYLKVRMYAVYAYFAVAIIIPILFVVYMLLIVANRKTTVVLNGQTYTTPTKVDNTIILIVAVSWLISLLLSAWLELNFQKSLQEANNVLGGSTNEQAKAQVL